MCAARNRNANGRGDDRVHTVGHGGLGHQGAEGLAQRREEPQRDADAKAPLVAFPGVVFAFSMANQDGNHDSEDRQTRANHGLDRHALAKDRKAEQRAEYRVGRKQNPRASGAEAIHRRVQSRIADEDADQTAESHRAEVCKREYRQATPGKRGCPQHHRNREHAPSRKGKRPQMARRLHRQQATACPAGRSG